MTKVTRVPFSNLAGVSCVSAAILLVELGITRLFSVLTWSHLAFLAVSLALFGLSASGVFLHVAARWHPPERLRQQLWLYATAFSLLTAAMGVFFLRSNVMPWFTSKSNWALAGVYLVAAAPFFAGGACLTLAISRLHGDINRVYGADLTGAALGCLLFIPALNVFGGAGPLLGAAGLGAVAALLFVPRGMPLRLAFAALVAAGCTTALLVHTASPSFLDVRYPKGVPRKAVFTKWNSHSRIGVYPEAHADWGLSKTYVGPRPRTLFMDIDASASTPILLAGNPTDLAYLRYEITAFGYRLLPVGGTTLVIGPGGGRDLWTGVVHGASRITGVEINSIIVNDVMSDRFRKQSGDIYHRHGVQVFVDDGRSFVARSPDRYDLIQASLVDTWAATAAGAFALSENNLYTVEAFVDYLEHLKPDGVLTVSRWSDDALRLLSLTRAAGERLGLGNMADRIMVVRQSTAKLSTFVIKRSPLSPGEVQRLAKEALDFEILYAPPAGGLDLATLRPEYSHLLTTRDPEMFYRHWSWDVSPPTDDRPFFFQSIKRSAMPAVLKSALFSGQTDGVSVLARLLYISTFLVAAFIIVPLAGSSLRRGQRRELGLDRLAYFGCLGLGFMLIEIGLMQRFVLFLGHPVYALTVILFTLLLGGGIGSSVSRRLLGSPRRVLFWALPAIALVGVAYAYALPPLFASCLGFGLPVRILLSAALLLPLGVLLGMPLPAGIDLLGQRRPELLAWAWAINGSTSVLGSILAVFTAILFGFRVVALVGSAVYAVAFLIGLRLAASAADAEPAEAA